MIEHKIVARHSGVPASSRLFIPLIKHCIRTALMLEGVDEPCEVSVLITNSDGIRKINREFRNVDVETDVLSFPMQEFSPPGWDASQVDKLNATGGCVHLGDIVLSADVIRFQANSNLQTCEAETAYLTVHSVLHLLGYDHIDEAEGKKKMREREKEIVRTLGE